MIAYLTGKVLDTQPDSVIILVGSIGYKVNLPHNSLLPETELSLFIYTHHNQDNGGQLWGFYQAIELRLFELLLQVNGVGPKTAALLIHDLGIAKVVEAVTAENPAGLKVPGIGAKTAERMIIDLRDKLAGFAGYVSSTSGRNQNYELILSALENLGYTRKLAEEMHAAANIPAEADLSTAIKMVLNTNRQ